MIQWITIAVAWVASLFAFWKLGEKNGKKNEKISNLQESEKTLAKATLLRNNVDSNVDGVRKKWKRSKQ